MSNKPTLCLDFDGVIHLYTSPWVDEVTISDGAVPGALEWIWKATEWWSIVIYSSRSKSREGRQAMMGWMAQESRKVFPEDHPMCHVRKTTDGRVDLMGGYPIGFAHEKPAAFLTIDDRAIQFMGDWMDIDAADLRMFKPWNKGGLMYEGQWSKRVDKLREITDIACSDGNADVNAYMHGMANGMILARSIMTFENGHETPPYLEIKRYTEKRWKPMYNAPKDRPIAILSVQLGPFMGGVLDCPVRGRHIDIDICSWREGDDGGCFVIGYNYDSKVSHGNTTAWCEVSELALEDILEMTMDQLEELAHGRQPDTGSQPSIHEGGGPQGL